MKCTRCPLADVGLSNCVGGRGDGPVLIIGQNPGPEEDLAGEPFIGPSGKLLEAMLRDAGFTSADYRLSNAVRCITPRVKRSLRAPTPNEVAACRTHLTDEILGYRPTVIIALGDTALRALTGQSGIMGKRGQPLPLHADFGHPCDVFPVPHPAWVLRTPMGRGGVVADLRRVRDIGRPQEKIAWQYAPAALSGSTVSYDIETYDEDGAITENMTMVSVTSTNGTVVSRTPEQAREIVAAIVKSGRRVVGHFSWDFDDKRTGIVSDYDTAALAYLFDETASLGLEALCVQHLGVRGWKEARDNARLYTDELAEYCARDSQLTLRLYDHFVDNLGTSRNGVPRIRIAEQILRPLRSALDECSRRGLYINLPRVEQERTTQAAAIDRLRGNIAAILSEYGFPAEAFNVQLKPKVRAVPFNPNSTIHVAKVLDYLGYSLPSTATEKDCTDAEVLGGINHPFARTMLEYREATKRMSTYILPYLKLGMEGDRRVHPSYTVIRTLTGRTSARNRNVQNLDRELKDFFTAPPGKVLLHCDLAAIEFWVAVWIAGVTRLIEGRLADQAFDPHRFFAAILYGVPESDVTPAQRQVAKSAHFSQLYGGGPGTIVHYMAGLGESISMKNATVVYKAFRKTYPEFIAWHAAIKAEMIQYGYVESPTGRRRHTGDVRLLQAGGAFEDAQREAANAVVQGFSTGDIAELGLIASHRAGLPINGFFHDAITYEADDMDDAQAMIPRIRQAMLDEPVRILKEQFNVDFPRHLLDIDIKMSVGV